MMHALIRGAFLGLIRLFYRRIDVKGREKIPTEGPAIVVANHPNGLLDPLLLRAALGKPVAFLAKSTLFSNPFGRLGMGAFGAIPVYRPKDGQDTSKNEETFARARGLLFEKGWLALFPEGISHSAPTIQPLKTGAARIALGAEKERGFALGLRILPIGLVYEEKHIFRSRVALSIGDPISVADMAAAHAADERAAVEAVTQRIHEALSSVVVEADTEELWRGFLAVASWTSDPPTTALAEVVPRAQALAQAYRRVSSEAPERAERVVEATRRFVRVLEAIGVRDPLALEAGPARPLAVFRAALPLLTLWPLALVGAALGWVPYRLVRPAAAKLSKGEADLVGTLKLILGTVVLTGVYLAEALLAGGVWGWKAGLATFALGPLTGFVALRYGERLELRSAALDAWWLRTTDARLAAAVAAQRKALTEAIRGEISRAERV